MSNKLKYKFVLVALLVANIAFAGPGKEKNPLYSLAYDNMLVIIGLLIILGAFFAIWTSLDSVMKYNRDMAYKANGLKVPEPKIAESLDVKFKRWYDKAWDLVPMEKEQDIDLGHDYDGIRELDNRLPPWWLWTFYFTIIFGVAYIYFNHYSEMGQSQSEEYAMEMEVAEEIKRDYLARQKNAVDETNVTFLNDDANLMAGMGVYTASCAACHGAKGEGGVGPNLTDPYWIHGGSIGDVFKTIKYGVPEKGMIAWQSQLQPKTMQKVASYILSMQGTNPPNGKAPQGNLYEPEDELTMNETK